MLPEAAQARKAIWKAINPHSGKKRIDEAFPKEIRKTTNDQEMFIEFKNGATWQVVGSDNYNSLVGSPPAGVVFSEWPLSKPDAWAYIRPILNENNGWAFFIYTPRGDNHGRTLFDFAKGSDDWFCELLTADDTGIFTPEQLASEREELTKLYGSTRGEALFRQEYYCSWQEAFVGKVVYPEFDANFHVADTNLLPIVQEAIKQGKTEVVRGWDNSGLHPGAAMTFLLPGGQWLIFKEFWEQEIGITDFGDMVKMWCAENLPGATYVDIGDPAGRIRDATKQSPRDYLSQHCNIYIEDGIQTFKVRRESVASRLVRQINGGPALVIDPSCKLTIDGFAGGYCYPEIGTTGIYKPEPLKDKYADVHDAIQYPATKLFGPVYNDDVGSAEPEAYDDW
jgi:hypothetical protein